MEIIALIAAVLALDRSGLRDIVAPVRWPSARIGSSSVLELRSALNETNDKLDSALTDLRLELRRRSGEMIFTRDDHRRGYGSASPGEPGARQFPPGRLFSCAVSDVDTIEGACQSYGIDQAAADDGPEPV